MRQNKKYGLLFIFIILVFMVSEAVASRTHMNFKLEYLNNKLSVNVEKVSLGSVLAEIQEKTGIKFQLDKESYDRIISVGFQALPLEKAIQRILNNLNHAVIFGPDYNIQKVIIVGKGKMSLASHVHEHNISSSSTAMIIESPVQEGMKITHPPDAMVIEPGGEGMKIAQTSDTDKMVIEQPDGKGMKITYDGEPMNITNDGAEMEITHDVGERKITNDGAKTEITHSSDKMQITHSPDLNPR